MRRLFAFLRAINVGGRIVKMDHLRRLFESFGFAHVETFIASGNVIFETRARDAAALEAKIASGLRAALGYDVAVFLRTETELAAIVDSRPFRPADLETAAALNIAFLARALGASEQRKLMTLRTDIDDFAVQGREIYWLCRKKQSESTFSNAVLEKTLGLQATLRGANTLRKLADRYARLQPGRT